MLRHIALVLLRNSYKNFTNQIPRNYFKFARFTSTNSDSVAGAYLYDEIKEEHTKTRNAINKFTERTHTCGELRLSDVGKSVILCGWLEYQRMGKFLVLRDSYGQIQLLVAKDDTPTQTLLKTLPLESILKIEGTVLSRPPNMINTKQITGEVEVLVKKFTILNSASGQLPFNIREFQKPNEAKRLKYRYLDMRFAETQRNLRLRSSVLMKMREYLINYCDFVDVETPTLFKATPGGAQEFIVPTRLPGQFYSLVQSPQQFKQMLMAGGIDRYFQVARCYRDEGLQSDKQPEFTQLDIEMSFTDVNGVIKLIEEVLQYSWPTFLNTLPFQFKRMTYADAMEHYGTDKPDTRFESKLHNCTDILRSDKGDNCFAAYYVVFRESATFLTTTIKTALQAINKEHPSVKYIHTKKLSLDDKWDSPLRKVFSEDVADKLIGTINPQENDVIFVAFGNKKECQKLLGRIRKEFAQHLNMNGRNIFGDRMEFLWIIDFPLFEKSNDQLGINSVHHPFTAPHPDDLHLLETSPLQVKSLAYDLVLNGNEIGGGSIRIHNAALQERVLELLKIDKNDLQHMLEMLKSGCPPHGGIALGLDRLFAVMLNTASIRNVIAFPKTLDGRDPISGAPSHVSEKDKKLYHIISVNR